MNWVKRIVAVVSVQGALTERCVVFVHINKSGGQTIKAVLHQHLVGMSRRVAYCTEREYAVDRCQSLRLAGRGSLRVGKATEGWVVIGDSTMALFKSLGPPRCTWLALFREPASRLVSAWHYCMRSRSDHLCGSSVLDARDATLQSWARHQRGFVFLRLAISAKALPLVHVPATPPSKHRYDDDDVEWKSTVPTWIRHQRAVLRRQALQDPMLVKITSDLAAGRLIQAVGVLERPIETARLFDAVLPLAGGLTWAKALRINHANARPKAHNASELWRARTDPNITQYL